ncbi:MAG: hypothetical protein IPM26_08170 [Saprospiraceae bacterium]|nr:hypothetical protein [Saprospiraceae bacterium]
MEQKIIGAVLIFVSLFAPLPDKQSPDNRDESLSLEILQDHKTVHSDLKPQRPEIKPDTYN